jgi:hypothetical protein
MRTRFSSQAVLSLFLLLYSSATFSQTWSTLPVDLLVSMNTSAPGTGLTTSVANAGTVSSQCSVGSTCNWTGVTDFNVGAYQGTMSNLGPIQMTGTGGALYPAQSLNFNNMAHNDAGNNTNGYLTMSGTPGSATAVSATVEITLGPPYQTSTGSDWDIFGIWTTSGQYYEAQLNNMCNAAGQYGIRIENGHPTTHSATCISLLPQQSYYISLWADFTTGTSQLWVFTANGSLVGTTTAITIDIGSTFSYLQVGNNESGNCTASNGCPTQTYTYFQNIMLNWTTAPKPLFWTNTAPSASVLAPGRATTWSDAGVIGGIPNRTSICSSLTSSATTAQINSAISSCGSSGGGVVSLGAGTYSGVTSGICFGGVSNVTLRGAGANQTFLAPSSGSSCGGGSVAMTSTANGAGTPQNGPVAVSGSVVQGSTTITLASVPNLKIGNPLILDQLDPTCDDGGIFVSGTGSGYTCTPTSTGLSGPYNTDGGGNGIRGGSGCSASPAGCYHQQQIVMVTSCNGVTTVGTACSGTNVAVGFSPGLHMPNWSAAHMYAWWATSPIHADSVEDLNVNSANNSGANGIQITNCQGCWVKGVESQQTSEAHVQLLYANHTQVENNYFFYTQNAATVSYGVECFACSDTLTENNIFQAVTTPEMNNGTSTGNVWGYNYTVNDVYTGSNDYSIPARGDHAAGSDMNLMEGNVSDGATGDVIHGTGNLMTFFRNYYSVQPECWDGGTGYSSYVYGSCTSGTTTMQIYSFHRFYSLIGNVLGTPGVNTTYNTGIANNTNVLGIGYGNGAVPNDPNVAATTMLWGNADAATGFGLPRFNCALGGISSSSEVPTFPAYGTTTSSVVAAHFPYNNSCPTSLALPSSFYYSSKPFWWPSSKPWPPIGPDVIGGNLGIVDGLVYTIPAEDCYLSTMNGAPNGSGGPYSFNESTCYATGGSGNPPPTPPSGLTATVN